MSEPNETPAENGTQNQSPSDVERMLARHQVVPPEETIDPPTDPWAEAQPQVKRTPLPARIGRFDIKKELGGGTFGRVLLAKDFVLNRDVAIKVPQDVILTSEFRDRFLREARATAAIHHPNVCPIYEAGADGELPYIVMRFVAGGTLLQMLREGCFMPATAVAIARKLADGLDAAHSCGVIHRDLKPANVLYDGKEMLLADFGLARIGFDAVMSSPGAGTVKYMSPEQARERANEIGPRSDVYSLGVIFYEMLTGQAPFTGDRYDIMRAHCEEKPKAPSMIRRHLDPPLDSLCLRALAKNPGDRYNSAREFAAALAGYLDKLDVDKARKPLPGINLTDAPRSGFWKRWLGFGEPEATQAQAHYSRGRRCYDGDGVPQDSTLARVLFEKAARLGFVPAQCCLGCLCAWGEGGPQDYAEARVWFERAAELNNAEAQYRLGLLHYDGLGGPLDQTAATAWWTKAARQGHASASSKLGAVVVWWH